MYKKYLIWDSHISLEETKEYDDGILSEEEIWQACVEANGIWLDDEKRNLDIPVEGQVLIIADLGLWNGRHSAYKVEDVDVLADILHNNMNGDSECRFYCDGYDIKCEESHHDGINHYTYREITRSAAAKKLMDKLYMQQPVSRKEITACTRSLAPLVAKVYG